MTTSSHSRINRLLMDSLLVGDVPTTRLGPSEWEDVWARARDHCIVPYLERRWTESGFIATVPETIATRFADASARNTERNRRLLLALDDLRRSLQEKGIPVLVSKGLPVAEAYYGDLGLRVLYDLDLLINAQCRRAGVEVLHENGYRPFFQNNGANKEQVLFWQPAQYAWHAEQVFDPGQPCFVELHTEPWQAGWHGFGLECKLDLWKGDRILQVAGVPLRVPLEEKLLVHLAVHYACNFLESNARLMHLLDILLLLRRRGDQLDWDMILEDINESRAAPFCFVALDLAQRMGDCAIPGRVWNTLHDATPRGIIDWLRLRGTDDACSMSLRHRDRSLIYSLHWHMAAGLSGMAGMLFYSLLTPWSEGAGMQRWAALGRRMARRLYHLARAHS